MHAHHRTRRAATGAVLVAVALAAGACGAGANHPAVAQGPSKGTSPTTAQAMQPIGSTSRNFGINALANSSDLAVVATVADAGALYRTMYASVDGRTTVPKLLQDVTLHVDQVVFDAPTAMASSGDRTTWSGPPTRVGDSLVVAVEQEGESVTTPSGYTVSADQLSGPFINGQQVFLLLRRYLRFAGPNNSIRTIPTLNTGWQGHWEVKGPMAVSIDPGRTVPLAGLQKRVLDERTAGRHSERDPGTEENPLAPNTSGS
jgi:hypothetical protein